MDQECALYDLTECVDHQDCLTATRQVFSDMKESKTRESLTSKKRKHGKGSSINLESWDQTDLEDADEKVLEKRLHQLKMQLEMDQDGEREKRLPNKYRKKYSEDLLASSDSDSSDSDTTLSSTSSASVGKYKSKKSSTVSDDDRRKRYSRSRSPTTKKRYSKDSKNSRSTSRVDRDSTINPKADKRIVFRKKTSPASDKYSRKKSPLLDRREIYSRVDTGRWHEKAKEFTKERNKREDHDKTRSRSRAERNRSISLAREPSRVSARAKDDRVPKRTTSRGTIASSAVRRKDSPEPSRTRVSHDAARRTTLVTRKLSPKDERTGRHDERKLDLKITRRNDTRADSRDVNLRVTRDLRDRKEPITKISEKARDRELAGAKTHRDIIEGGSVDRERSRVNDDRFKDRDKRLQDRVEPDRNARNASHGSRDATADDKFRRNERAVEVNRGGGVFDRMRNRYNDRRNAENNQRLNRERERVADKEPVKTRVVDLNGGAEKMARERRSLVPQTRARSPLHRERKEPERNTTEKRSHSPVNFDKRFSSPLNARKAREPEIRIPAKRKSQENDNPLWNKKKTFNEIRSRSRSSERRRRKSSQEEWRVIDMTSPVLDDEFSDDNIGSFENNTQSKSRRAVANKVLHVVKNDEHHDLDPNRHKPILTDELSDISDEDFGDINANNNSIRTKKDILPRSDRLLKPDQISRNCDQKSLKDCNNVEDGVTSAGTNKITANYVDDLIGSQKLPSADDERVDFEKGGGEDLDSEEDTDLITVSRVSDALGVDWTDLVEESKGRAPSSMDASYSIRQRWKATSILARIGVSEKYAGEELYNEIEKDIMALEKDDLSFESRPEDVNEKLWHKVPSLHVSLKDKALKRRTLFEPYKTAISVRKDIMLRRRLCGLPVKNLHAQQIIGICHWLV